MDIDVLYTMFNSTFIMCNKYEKTILKMKEDIGMAMPRRKEGKKQGKVQIHTNIPI